MRFILIIFFSVPFFCNAQNAQVIKRNIIIPDFTLAQPYTFQLVVPTAKYMDLYNQIVTDSLLRAISSKRQQHEDITLSLNNKGMNILILSEDKVANGIKVPKVEVQKIKH